MNSRDHLGLFPFFRVALQKPLEIGAIAPSSRVLGKAIASLIDAKIAGPIVELGSGTGVVTESLLEHGISSDRLILIETDRSFLDKLSCRYPKALCISESAYNLDRIRETIYLRPAAVIVSCLPILLRSAHERIEFMDAVGRTLMPGGLLVQYSYGIGPPLRNSESLMICPKPKRIWLNIPPATIWVYKKRPIVP